MWKQAQRDGGGTGEGHFNNIVYKVFMVSIVYAGFPEENQHVI